MVDNLEVKMCWKGRGPDMRSIKNFLIGLFTFSVHAGERETHTHRKK